MILHPLWRAPFGANYYLYTILFLLIAISGVVLLLACTNVANLLLVRGVGRRRELAIITDTEKPGFEERPQSKEHEVEQLTRANFATVGHPERADHLWFYAPRDRDGRTTFEKRTWDTRAPAPG